MHQQVIAGAFLGPNLLRHPGRHRYRRYSGRADQRIDLSSASLHMTRPNNNPPIVAKQSKQTEQDNFDRFRG